MISSSRSQDGSTTEFMSLWKGIVHAHSTYSFDGQCDYSELRNLFRGAGLDFACMTEHIEHLDQHDIDEIIRECRAYSDEKFLFIPGIEMDCFVIFFLGIQETKVDFTNNRTIYRSVRPNTALCVLSHPIKADFSYPDWVLRDCDAVEVLNAKHDGKFYFRPQSGQLLATIRGKRPEVQPLVGMDFHYPAQL